MKNKIFLFFFLVAVEAFGQNASQFYQDAMSALREQDFIRAASLLRRSLQTNPNYLQAHEELALVFFQLGEDREAEFHAREASRLSGEQGRSQLILAKILMTKGPEGVQNAQNLLGEITLREGEGPELWAVLGDLEVMKQRLPLATRYYTQVLQRDPRQFKALFSLFQIEEHLGNTLRAGVLMENLLRYHGAEPEVLYRAAVFFQNKGDLERADQLLLRLSELSENWTYPDVFIQASQQRARFELAKHSVLGDAGTLERAIPILMKALEKGPNNAMTYYLLGAVNSRLKRWDEAQKAMKRAVDFDKDNELLRLSWEASISQLPVDNPLRAIPSQYHLEMARTYSARNMQDWVRDSYRRALFIDPLDKGARWGFTSSWKSLGFKGMYLENLLRFSTAMSSERQASRTLSGEADRELGRELGYWRDRWYVDESLGKSWGLDLDQFRNWLDVGSWALNIQGEGGRGFRIAVFTRSSGVKTVDYSDKEKILTEFLVYQWEGVMAPWPRSRAQGSTEEIRVGIFPSQILPRDNSTGLFDRDSSFVEEEEEAIRLSRRQGADFFVLLDFLDLNQTFTVQAGLHMGSTGRLVRRISVSRRGSGRILGAVREFIQKISEYFPLRAVLAQKRTRNNQIQGLIPLGTLHGVKIGDKFSLLKPGIARLGAELPLVQWAEGDLLGILTITKVEDWLCEGTIVPSDHYDLTTPGDEVFLRRNTPENLAPLPPSLNVLQRDVLKVR